MLSKGETGLCCSFVGGIYRSSAENRGEQLLLKIVFEGFLEKSMFMMMVPGGAQVFKVRVAAYLYGFPYSKGLDVNESN